MIKNLSKIRKFPIISEFSLSPVNRNPLDTEILKILHDYLSISTVFDRNFVFFVQWRNIQFWCSLNISLMCISSPFNCDDPLGSYQDTCTYVSPSNFDHNNPWMLLLWRHFMTTNDSSFTCSRIYLKILVKIGKKLLIRIG